jgi:Mg2+ and Co2+ transporter CorA
MNVHFPGFNSWAAFVASIGFMLVTVIGMLGFFRWKKWL